MKKQFLAIVFGIISLTVPRAHGQSTAFTYQGQLIQGAAAATGNYDMKFNVWDASAAGNFIAGPITNTAVVVSNGLFTVSLDFGASVLTGSNYWVELNVRTNGNGAFATLSPRQQLTPAAAAFSLSTQSPQYSALCPAGSVMAYAGSSAPAGWLVCDGSAVSRTTYAALFAVVGTTYGAGDGSTTFNLPDLRSRSVVGAGSGGALTARALGESMGAETITLQVGNLPKHQHRVNGTISGGSHTHSITGPCASDDGGSADTHFAIGDSDAIRSWPSGVSITGGSHSHTIDFNSSDDASSPAMNSTPFSNMQPSLGLNYIIKQ